MPRKYLSFVVTIHRELEQAKIPIDELTMRKFDVFVGRGNDFETDRLYIRRELNSFVMEPKGKIVREAIVYFPIPILHSGAELVDAPGFGDAMESRKRHVENMLETSKVVWIISTKSIKHEQEERIWIPKFLEKVCVCFVVDH